jgi:hypothetical protein
MQRIPIVHLVAILSLTDGPLSDAAYSPSATESAVTAPREERLPCHNSRGTVENPDRCRSSTEPHPVCSSP